MQLLPKSTKDQTLEISAMVIDKNRQDELEEEEEQPKNLAISKRQLVGLGLDENVDSEMIEHQPDDEGVEADENNGDEGSLAQQKKGTAAFMACRSCGKKNDHRTSKCSCKPTGPEAAACSKRSGDSFAQQKKGAAVIKVCRSCGKKNGHRTSKCPYKDLAMANKRPIGKATGPEAAAACSEGSGDSLIDQIKLAIGYKKPIGKPCEELALLNEILDKFTGPETAASNKGSGDSLAQLGKGAEAIRVCGSCGKKNDHRTSKCSCKDLDIPNKISIGKPTGPEAAASSLGTGYSLAHQGNGVSVFMVCRSCGEKNDHCTSKCPHKNLAPPVETFLDKPTGHQAAVSSKDSNVPPNMRAVVETPVSEMPIQHRDDENSVMFTDLLDNTSESDLLELCRIFGKVSGVCIPIDQKTGVSQGFGIVNFVNKKDAAQAIKNLNGYYYGQLLLQVDWATPRTS